MNKWTILEEKNFYTVFKDGSEAEIEMDIAGDVSVLYGEWEVDNIMFTNIKLFIYPGRECFQEFKVKEWDQLFEYIPKQELVKIKNRAEEMLINYREELEKERSGLND